MVSLWVNNSYFNIELIKTSGIGIMIYVYGSSGLFGYRLRSKFVGQNTYTGRKSNFRSKPTSIHGPIHK